MGSVRHRDLCVVVSLDVRNAFNTTQWRRIDAALRERLVPPYLNSMIRSYLENRSLLVGEVHTSQNVKCGVPQGSVLGPALLNIFYEELLDTDMPLGVQLLAFADDVVVIVTSRTRRSAANLLNPALETVSNWMLENGLTIAPQKSDADEPVLYIESHAIPVKPAIRYLRVELLTRLSFMTYVATASRKAIESAKAIGRLMPNVDGPAKAKRALSPTASYCTLHRPGQQSPSRPPKGMRWLGHRGSRLSSPPEPIEQYLAKHRLCCLPRCRPTCSPMNGLE